MHTPSLLLVVFAGLAVANIVPLICLDNLISNSFCDINIAGWDNSFSLSWLCNNFQPFDTHSQSFCAGNAPYSVLSQTVDVSRFSVSIDEGRESFTFSCVGRNGPQSPSDEGGVLVQYLDSHGTTLSMFNQSFVSPYGWILITDTRIAPVGTRAIKVTLRGVRHSGDFLHAYFSAIFLCAHCDPTKAPTRQPATKAPTLAPTSQPTIPPTSSPTPVPTIAPSPAPTTSPTPAPSPAPSPAPTPAPTPVPTIAPTTAPSAPPTTSPTSPPTDTPTDVPTPVPTIAPTPIPTDVPTPVPTPIPTVAPTPAPTPVPTPVPSVAPTDIPSPPPSTPPTIPPTGAPTPAPTIPPTGAPTPAPTTAPTARPTPAPTRSPTGPPTAPPTIRPTPIPTPIHVCGDGVCTPIAENCQNCPTDCGLCPLVLIDRNDNFAVTAASFTPGSSITLTPWDNTTTPTPAQSWNWDPSTGYISNRAYPNLILGGGPVAQNIPANKNSIGWDIKAALLDINNAASNKPVNQFDLVSVSGAPTWNYAINRQLNGGGQLYLASCLEAPYSSPQTPGALEVWITPCVAGTWKQEFKLVTYVCTSC